MAQLGALPDLLRGVGAVGVGHAGPAFHALEAGAGVHAAVVGRGLEEHQLAPLDVLLLVLGRDVAGLQVASFNSVGQIATFHTVGGHANAAGQLLEQASNSSCVSRGQVLLTLP